MTDPTITCPSCKSEIKLTESLAAPLLESTRQQYEQQIAAKAKELDEKLAVERQAIAKEEESKAKLRVSTELQQTTKELLELQEVLKLRDEKLAEAQKSQADFLKKQRVLDDAIRELELTVEKRVQDGLGAERTLAKQRAEDQFKLKLAESEQKMLGMQKTIDELNRKMEQGSQQLQGEVSELEIENTLRIAFPTDIIEPVPKGEFGGDTVQRICGDGSNVCGTILWESKRTKNWSDGWLPKLRDDQRAAKADYAVIVTQTMPKLPDSFEHIDGVWVTCPRLMVPVAICLRQAVLELAMARKAGEGQQTKMELVYQYLSGPKFRHRVEAIVEKFSEMQEDLHKERKAMLRMWAKRETQIRAVVESTAGMYGDLQGIAGKTMLEIEGLSLNLLTADNEQLPPV